MKEWFKSLDRKNTDSIKWRLAEEACQGTDCYTFSIADSDYETAPVIKQALLKRVDHGAFGYIRLDDEYGKVIVDWYKERYNVNISKESIISAPTVLNALSIVLDLFSNDNDDVIIQTPVYHVFKPVIELNHRCVLESPLKLEGIHYSMDFSLLEKQFKSGAKVFTLCNPHNPVGRVWTKEEIDHLVKLAKENNVLIISDEIHSDIIMPGYSFTSLAKYFDVYENIIVISAPTKVFNIAGLQIAQIIVENPDLNEKLRAEYLRLHLSTPNLLALIALKAAYKSGQAWLDAQNNHIQSNYNFMKLYLDKYPKYFKVFPLEGTYLTWIKVSLPNMDVPDFVENLTQYGVFLSDGEKFGCGQDYIRASLACSRQQLQTGLNEMDRFLKECSII